MPILGATKEGGLADPSWRSFFISSLFFSTLNQIQLTLLLLILGFLVEQLRLYRHFD